MSLNKQIKHHRRMLRYYTHKIWRIKHNKLRQREMDKLHIKYGGQH